MEDANLYNDFALIQVSTKRKPTYRVLCKIYFRYGGLQELVVNFYTRFGKCYYQGFLRGIEIFQRVQHDYFRAWRNHYYDKMNHFLMNNSLKALLLFFFEIFDVKSFKIPSGTSATLRKNALFSMEKIYHLSYLELICFLFLMFRRKWYFVLFFGCRPRAAAQP